MLNSTLPGSPQPVQTLQLVLDRLNDIHERVNKTINNAGVVEQALQGGRSDQRDVDKVTKTAAFEVSGHLAQTHAALKDLEDRLSLLDLMVENCAARI